MAEGTPAPTGDAGHWRPFGHDSGYSTTTPSPSSIPSLSPELRTATGPSPRKLNCISTSTPAVQFPCPLAKRNSIRKPFLSLSDLEDSVFEPGVAGNHDEPFQDVFEDMEVDDMDHQEVVQEKTNAERKTFVLEGCHSVPHTRQHPNRSYIGRERVDFLALMGELNNYTVVLSNIFKYLSVEDLLNVSLVCKRWWRICKADRNVQTRMTKYLEKINKNKENLRGNQPKKSKSTMSDLMVSTPRRHFLEIQNISRENNTRSVSTRSPPVSPSKFRFHQFFKAAQTISDGSALAPCPRCSLPSLIDSNKNVGQCTREGCRYIYCCLCHCESHGMQPCRTSMLAPRSRKRLGSIGSKASKRNLRRLC